MDILGVNIFLHHNTTHRCVSHGLQCPLGLLNTSVPDSVGFGDLAPTKTLTKILLFPFALIGIVQLGSILTLMIDFFSHRAATRKEISRALSERQRHVEQDRRQIAPDLLQEVDFLVRLNAKQDKKDHISELILSIAGFLVFWFVGAAIFTGTEVRDIFGTAIPSKNTLMAYFCASFRAGLIRCRCISATYFSWLLVMEIVSQRLQLDAVCWGYVDTQHLTSNISLLSSVVFTIYARLAV